MEVPDSDLDIRVYYTPPKFSDGTVVVCHHGAGYSGLSFACFAKEVVDMSKGECGVLSLDCRAHGKHQLPVMLSNRNTDSVSGKTTHLKSTSTEEDLSIDTLTADLVNMLQVVYPEPETAPSLLVCLLPYFT